VRQDGTPLDTSRVAPHRPAAGTFRALPPVMWAFLPAVVALGAVLLALGVMRAPGSSLPLLLGLLAASAATATIKLPLPLTTGGSTLSLAYVVSFIALLCLGPFAAVPIAVTSAWIQCTFGVRRRNPSHQTLFSMAVMAVSVCGAGLAYEALGRLTSETLAAQGAAAGMAATVYFLLNTALVAAAVAFSSGGGFGSIWTQNFLWTSPTYFIGALIALLAVAVARAGGAVPAVMLAGPVYITYRSYRAYTERVEQEQRQAQLAADLQLDVIEALALAIEAKDHTSRYHLRMMQAYAEGLARAAGLGEDEVRGVRTAALLHDIGNLGVPDHILSKQGRLTDAEFERVKVHPRVGAEILESVRFPYPVTALIVAHHERWDGRGYPEQLQGTDIPLGARILSVVDCFVAMLADRPHRGPRTHAEAIATLRENSGSALDPSLVETFIGALPHIEARLEHAGARGSAPAAEQQVPGTALDDIAVAHREELVLREIAEALTTSLQVSDVTALVSARLAALVPFTAVALFLHDEASGLYLCRQATGTHQDLIRGVTAATVEGLEQTPPGQGAGRRLGGARLESVLVAPLQMDQRVVGALAFYHTAPAAYTAEHGRLAFQAAAQAAPVIVNAVAFEQAQEQSLTDLLTRLPNRRYVDGHLAQELSRARRGGTNVSLLLLDLDRFKTINDEFGHQAGDRALVEVAQTLRASLRSYDICARLAGDEFVVVLSGCDGTQAERRGRALQEAVARASYLAAPGRQVNLGISVGCATFPVDGQSPDALLAVADRRMYEDKSSRKQALANPGQLSGA
jgi:diguanylate cyclase (GGDEF)-like protein/putative nucleotidyltransferase with HDIG domain